jgi:hypothetical protein
MFAKILMLFYISSKFVNIPNILILATVFLPAYNNFTGLGFHRNFYKNYVTHEPGNVKKNYQIYVSLLISWLVISVIILSLILLLKNSSYQDYYISIIIVTCDRILDERLRLHFFRRKIRLWIPISILKTFAPTMLIVVMTLSNTPILMNILFLAYSFIVVLFFVPKVFYKSIIKVNVNTIRSEFFQQSIFSFAATSRRSLDRILAVLLLGNDAAFAYNIIVQIATGSVLIFDKFIQILERQSYLIQHSTRVVVNRLPFVAISLLISIGVIYFDSRTYSIEGVVQSVILACVLAWILSVTDRELEYNWWQGRAIAISGSRVSILMSISYLLIVFALQISEIVEIDYILLAAIFCTFTVYSFVKFRQR